MHTVKLKINDDIYNHIMFFLKSLDNNKIKILEEKKQKTVSKDDNEDTKLFSNHSANLIEDWQDLEEDNIWK
ncbi:MULTISPECIES: hypothetical protein [Aliarcobacter]|jgi:hypothetical protein|uniref:DUF2281 domain-containing protein n=4 Tax=Arcobacteraceae TaxID=2808963 RepID=A0AAU0P4U7_9BACT|nr:hypothetical protein [Aliarcobacter cryaerophilus]WNL17207.1 hypothetical protein RJG54_02105 [Arcobacter sp. AZ-2023]WPD04317.1 hypothetical protein QUR79_05370 [Arcobacter sp. DSM 115972]MCT7445162.1 hypothetical protein [Aliarcobacter cryaerophilus]MCT7463161.1 hypothetical protein [Aliarcobacter cryaerophilus]MCT7465325.1 hypothetical protein [Aliarcobacter cryaerophilus]